jgi:hypothetical protein
MANDKKINLKTHWKLIQEFNNMRIPSVPPIDNINSWDYLEATRNNMIADSDNHESMEPAWKILNDFYGDIFDREGKNADIPINDFIYSTTSGFYPRPEVLKLISDCFERYFFMEGIESLEEIFFGNVKKRVGNYSAQRANNMDVNALHRLLKQNNSPYNKLRNILPLSQLEAAELVIKEMKLSIEPESLIKKYQRYIKRNRSNEFHYSR